ncbi:sulfite exporter TauE/SafE family protein [Halomonas sp. EGI 63088]|uniref:Probable membrane transporter protein n=1 Tax=Halomonas flagellata TaxID=2920385 RepID=A0ABS9RYE8_9GAMM|nr:sulfite exporter TauE/SafE family protein [Halomonas flagellata]MCH4564839.1 sulfite exporter TauE/SafE family protein [Halomonas flagellata]
MLALVGVTFLAAGTVKGVIGMGMPTVSLALLTATLGLHSAMALLLVPTVITNVWQALVGGRLVMIARRLWPFLVTSVLAVWPGVVVLAGVDVRWPSRLLGGLIIGYALMNLGMARLVLPVRHERRAGVISGVANGLLTGMTGSSVFPGVAYLQALGLPRDQLIQAMGILFTLCTLTLGLAMGEQDLLTGDLMLTSSLAVIPAILGMQLGQRLRRRLSEASFRRFFFSGLLVMGGYIVLRSLGG